MSAKASRRAKSQETMESVRLRPQTVAACIPGLTKAMNSPQTTKMREVKKIGYPGRTSKSTTALFSRS